MYLKGKEINHDFTKMKMVDFANSIDAESVVYKEPTYLYLHCKLTGLQYYTAGMKQFL